MCSLFLLPCPWHFCRQARIAAPCWELQAQHRNSILSALGRWQQPKRIWKNQSIQSNRFFLNAAFPILLAQGMLWTSLFNTHHTQIISAHLTWMQARVWVFFPVQLLLPLPEKAGKSCYPVCWTLIISCGSSSQSWYVGPRSIKKWEHFLGIKSHSIFSPLWLGGLKQQHQWHNERSCYSPVQGHFPIPHEEQKALETN